MSNLNWLKIYGNDRGSTSNDNIVALKGVIKRNKKKVIRTVFLGWVKSLFNQKKEKDKKKKWRQNTSNIVSKINYTESK